MEIYGRTQVMAEYSIRQCLDLLKQWQFDGVEICFEHPELTPANFDTDTAKRICERLSELEMSCSASYHKNYIYDDELFTQTKNAIQWTPLLDTDIFIIAGCPRRNQPDQWQRKIDRTRELVKVAEDVGVIIAHEFEPGFIVGNTEQMLRMFDEIDSEHLQANLDLGHVFLCDPDPMAAIASLKGKVCHGHIENMKAGVHCHLPPWEGDMDLAIYLKALDDIGFDGPLALDLYNEKYAQVGRQSVEFIKNILPKN